MSGFDAVTLVPPNARLMTDALLPPEPLAYCLDCDVSLERWSAWTVAVRVPGPEQRLGSSPDEGFWSTVSPLCRRCAVRRDPELAP